MRDETTASKVDSLLDQLDKVSNDVRDSVGDLRDRLELYLEPEKPENPKTADSELDEFHGSPLCLRLHELECRLRRIGVELIDIRQRIT